MACTQRDIAFPVTPSQADRAVHLFKQGAEVGQYMIDHCIMELRLYFSEKVLLKYSRAVSCSKDPPVRYERSTAESIEVN
jgi:hypothetical protein